MSSFEFRFVAACGTPLQIGTVDAPSMIDALWEIAEMVAPDADAVRMVIEEVRE